MYKHEDKQNKEVIHKEVIHFRGKKRLVNGIYLEPVSDPRGMCISAIQQVFIKSAEVLMTSSERLAIEKNVAV